jgi:hypothetical protein
MCAILKYVSKHCLFSQSSKPEELFMSKELQIVVNGKVAAAKGGGGGKMSDGAKAK